MMEYLNLKNKKKLIEGVILYPLKVNRDSRGILVETLKTTWKDVFSEERPFVQNYFSITNSGIARDENLWHYHPLKQEDRFIVIAGDLIFAIYDWRKKSKTEGLLNLFKMGELNGDDNQYLLLVPKNVLHGFCVVSKKPATLLNYPTSLYDKKEEGRVPFLEVEVKLPNGQLFNWDLVRKEFNII